jgi:ATP-dependent helicase HrpA
MPTPPRIQYPADLPVSGRRDDILAALASHQVVVVAGATGSGKTTQLPKMLLELGKEKIAHTQPRRIAARAVAERIAEELGQELGGVVGYRVRFTDQVGRDTKVTLMTDGILLNAIHRDPDLRAYDAIIIDEAHERSLTVDFLLGYLTRLLPRRPDLTVVVTSATIDPESFARHFANADGIPAPIVEVSGRTYPVEVRYRPLVPEESPAERARSAPESPESEPIARSRREDSGVGAGEPRDTMTAILDALRELPAEGDVLVFLSGEAEIRDAVEAIEGAKLAGTEALPLYGRLSAAEQHRVFDRKRPPGIRRRVIVATNVAETSLTVPGIRYVIDEGSARISRYSARSKIQRLPIEPISQASAAQRAGRSGREAPGIAIRLYSETDFDTRPEFTEPEILRTDLAAVLLQMAVLGLGDIAEFPFITPPDRRGVRDGLDLLRELRALDVDGEVTRTGRRMSRLPLDPRLGRMLIEAQDRGVEAEVIPIVAGISIQDPRERPVEQREAADRAHARFVSPVSDFLSILALWKHLTEQQSTLSSSAFRRMLRSEYLSYLRVREWQDVVRQLNRSLEIPRASGALRLASGSLSDRNQRRSLSERSESKGTKGAGDDPRIHQAILAGLLSRVGVKDRVKRDYLGARGARFVIHPSSALNKRQPEAVMSAELVETSRLFARMNAAIDPAWAEALAGDLAVRTHSAPRWERKQGSAVADERVTLYGVPIVAKRRILLSRIDLPLARELFVRHALVEGDFDSSRLDRRLTAFLRDNADLRARLQERQERERRTDLLLDDEVVVAFYLSRLPDDIATTRDFERWWKTTSREEPDRLTMTEPDLVDAADELDPDAFPTEWVQGSVRLPLAYRFEPNHPDDGVTAIVPLAVLPRLTDDLTDWLVPGLRDELIAALLRALPKPLRREVVPANDWARRLGPELPAAPDGRLTERLSALIRSRTAAPARADDFELERLPTHLVMNFRVVDERGRVVGTGRDLGALQDQLKEAAAEAIGRLGGLGALRAVVPAGASTRSARSATGDADPRASDPGSASTRSARSATEHSVPERGAKRRVEGPPPIPSTTWTFGTIPLTVDLTVAGNPVLAHPALHDLGDAVELRMSATAEDAARTHRGGVRRLLALAVPSPAAHIQQHLTSAEKMDLAASAYPSTAALIADAITAVADAAIGETPPRTEAEFVSLRDRVSAGSVDEAFSVVALAAATLRAARSAEQAIRETSSLSLMGPLADAKAQLAALVPNGFISATGAAQLPRLRVYLEGLEHRVRRLAENPGRDHVRQSEVEQATELFEAAGGTLPLRADAPDRLVRARWLLEELRLSLFAQHLRTAESASLQRIRKALA